MSSPKPVTVPVLVTPELPRHLVTPLSEPQRRVSHNRDLLQLLADYESLRRRANADRASVYQLLLKPGSAGEQ
ncbi:hypothetical protein EI420_10465 [Vreelandella venusta]|nr:hypothetical protein EI420_10465 [Halomonas venusta]